MENIVKTEQLYEGKAKKVFAILTRRQCEA